MALSQRWLLGFVLASAVFGCRRFDVCGTDAKPCEPDTDAALLGGAGAGGDGGQGASSDCSPTRQSCDRSTLNGCETDLLTNPRHCGTCDNECMGVCAGGNCVPFEVRVQGVHEPAANVIVTESDAFFAAPATCCFGPVSLGRYDLETGALSWLARDAWSGVTGLAVSATRVYVIGDFSLFSIPLVGGDLRDEGIACDSISVAGATVAALVSGEVYVRSGDQGEFALLPTASYVDAMAATRSTVYVARDHGSAPGFTLEEHNLVYDQYEVLATGAGYARSLHVIDDSNSTYVVTESESSDDIFELYDLNALRAGTPLLQFPWDSQWTLTSTNSAVIGRAWIGTYHEGNRSGLRLVTFWDQPLILEWPTVGVVETLSATETDLWFVDPAGDAIVSVDVEAMVVGAIASIE